MIDVNFITDGLNDKQLLAVKSTEGYVRVTAGAGSGKTKTLAHRFAYIVEELGISPGNILCVTFTNKAAQEMRNRVRKLVTCGNTSDFICTYHGFCVKFLREEIYHLCYNKGFVILDEEDQKSILKDVYVELGITSSDLTYSNALKEIHLFKCIDRVPFDKSYIQYLLPAEIAKLEGLRKPSPLIENFLKRQSKLSALDFEDLINFTIYILTNYDDIQQKWQNRIHYVMVDETQDNSDNNWFLADRLSLKHKNLFIVGDPDQAIYEWRGAMPDAFIKFNQKFQPCLDIILDENYRSTPNILNVANSVIANNKNRIKKDLFTRKSEGPTVIHYHGKNEIEEGRWIAENISNLIINGATPSSFAVLYRASYISRYVEQALIQKGLKYTVYGGIRFFERKEIKDCLSYLRLIANGDDLSFLRIINTPSRKVGDSTKKKLIELAESDKVSLYDALKSHIAEESFNKPNIKEFIRLIEECRDYVKVFTISDLLDFILKESGLKDMYRLDGDEDRLQNIDELMHSIILYEEINKEEENLNLDNYLQDIALYTNLDYKENVDTIKLMTIHQAKGLEFPYVFVCGMYEGTFPNYRTVRERKIRGLEEERRLAYVALTRAETALFLTESEGYDFANKQEKYPSRFISEIKKEYYLVEGVIPESIINGAKYVISKIDDEIDGKKVNKIIDVGTRVKHMFFGTGEIKSIDENQQQYLVKFDKFEDEKPISFLYNKWEILDDKPEANTDSELRNG